MLDVLLKDNPDVKIVAEDLGDMRPQVYELRDAYHLPGMKIIQFTFDPMEHNNLFEDRENMIVYTGTHDNETIKGWLEGQPPKGQDWQRKENYMHGGMRKTPWRKTLSAIRWTIRRILRYPSTGRAGT